MTGDNECCRPNFFLIGAAKCGTTSVASYLDQHPDVFVSKPKEPNFFSFEPGSTPMCTGPGDPQRLYELLLKYSVTSPTEYAALFKNAEGKQAIGEASVRYLYEPHTAARLAGYAPDAKLIVLLRDPVDRLHSHYHMNVRQHIEPLTLADAIDAEDQRVTQGWGWDWHYQRVGLYGKQLQEVYEHFDRSQVLVLFHADLQQQPEATMRSIFVHLGVSPDFEPDFSRRAMVGHTPRWRGLRHLVRDENLVKTVAKRVIPSSIRKSFVAWSEAQNRQPIPQMDRPLREKVAAYFTEDRQHLAELLGKSPPW